MDPLPPPPPGVFSYERWSVDNSVDKTKVVESWQNKRRAYLSIIIGKLRGQVRIERFAAKKRTRRGEGRRARWSTRRKQRIIYNPDGERHVIRSTKWPGRGV